MCRFRSALVSVATLLTFLACSRGGATKQQSGAIRIGTFSRAIDYAPFYVARSFKWFEQNPLLRGRRVEYAEFNDRSLISSSLNDGHLQAIFAAEPPLIITRAEGVRISIVAISCTLQQEIAVRASLPVQGISDLKGRTVAVLQTTSSEYGLLHALQRNGLDRSSVRIEYLAPDVARARFEAGQIDAWAVWPPFIEEQQVSGRARVIRGGDAVIQSVMAEPETFIQAEPDVARALTDVIQHAKQWIAENPQEAQRIVATELGLKPEVISAAWGKHEWSAQLDSAVVADIQEKATFLANSGTTSLKRPLDVRRELVHSMPAR